MKWLFIHIFITVVFTASGYASHLLAAQNTAHVFFYPYSHDEKQVLTPKVQCNLSSFITASAGRLVSTQRALAVRSGVRLWIRGDLRRVTFYWHFRNLILRRKTLWKLAQKKIWWRGVWYRNWAPSGASFWSIWLSEIILKYAGLE
jgi:hypothetical protein